MLIESRDIVIAIDINIAMKTVRESLPGYFDTVFGSIQIISRVSPGGRPPGTSGNAGSRPTSR